MIKDRMDLLAIKHNRIIQDPFPEHSEYQAIKLQLGPFWSKWVRDIPKPEEISIHKAYRLGYEKAYKEIEDAL